MVLRQRPCYLLGLGLCVALMATALYFEHVMGLEPCPLCAFQRIFVIALGALMLVGAVHDPAGVWQRLYGVLIVLLGGLGVAVAGRHVWLQSLPPDQVPECGPGLEYILDSFPPFKALELILSGSGECAEVQWTFLGLSIPGWTLIIFVGISLFGLLVLLGRVRSSRGRLASAS
ncbi:MAG: disulfide bond formation protein B [Gammaproteobacteria bacterium]|nr:disulfide bond formation protein B [Gammaproteobacteria bacterium]